MIEVPRNTRQRRAVIAILQDIDGFASAQEIHDFLKQRGESVGLSTVYRSLQALADTAEIDALRNDDGEVLYRQCSSGHTITWYAGNAARPSRSKGQRSNAGPTRSPRSTVSSTSPIRWKSSERAAHARSERPPASAPWR